MRKKNITIQSKLKKHLLQILFLFFRECIVKRNAMISNGEYQADLEKDIKKAGEHTYNVELQLSIYKEDLEVSVVANAQFIYKAENYEREESVINNNTVAIMFPFIRSQVTLLTTQPGMAPIVLPPINTKKICLIYIIPKKKVLQKNQINFRSTFSSKSLYFLSFQSSMILLFTIFTAIDLIFLISQKENMFQSLFNGGDTPGIFAADDIYNLFRKFQLLLFYNLSIFYNIHGDIVVNKTQDGQIKGVNVTFYF